MLFSNKVFLFLGPIKRAGAAENYLNTGRIASDGAMSLGDVLADSGSGTFTDTTMDGVTCP